MLVIFGIRVARIARFIDTSHICYPCKAYDREILVYRSYFHFCLIPVFPVGPRQFEIRCRNCGDETRSESLFKEYEPRARTPFYFYSAWILVVGIALFWFYWNKASQKHTMEIVRNPVAGDVYTIRQKKNDETSYYFLRIIGITRDSLMAFRNNLDYGDFVSHMASDDYFVKDDTVFYKRKAVLEMLENDEIYDVSRDYGEGSGFNRIH